MHKEKLNLASINQDASFLKSTFSLGCNKRRTAAIAYSWRNCPRVK
jgi:hypothetical protein